MLKRGEITKVIELSGFSRMYVYEYITNPLEWKGSGSAAQKILSALNQVISERKKSEEKAQAQLAKLLNQSESIA